MCCGNTCTKYLMFIFNFVFALAGIALLVVGALTQAQISEVNQFLDGKFSGPPIVLIVLGSVIFVVAFLGCCGAVRESTCMLTTFAVFLILFLVIGVVIGILAFVFKNQIKDELAAELRSAVDQYNSNQAIRESVDSMQKALIGIVISLGLVRTFKRSIAV
ncbi:23 kDa integral membrane protein-like isoform X2 [Bacillus rossius redtenbacheri]|uniref:23 kDa integral membrane protein-like isoform X2 n=1 Tax=Bacillus rossius redtenbacheri TaxID=93214 RepID=UPI002FDCCF4E